MLPHVRAIALSVMSGAAGFSAAYLALPPRSPAPTSAPASPPAQPLPVALATPCDSLPTSPLPSLLPSTLPPPTLVPPTTYPPPLTPTVPRFGAPLLGSFRIVGIGPGGGLRLGRVLPQTLASAIGLQSGDELLSINQFQLGNPEQALTAYARLRTADRLTLAVARRGKLTEIVYSIR